MLKYIEECEILKSGFNSSVPAKFIKMRLMDINVDQLKWLTLDLIVFFPSKNPFLMIYFLIFLL